MILTGMMDPCHGGLTVFVCGSPQRPANAKFQWKAATICTTSSTLYTKIYMYDYINGHVYMCMYVVMAKWTFWLYLTYRAKFQTDAEIQYQKMCVVKFALLSFIFLIHSFLFFFFFFHEKNGNIYIYKRKFMMLFIKIMYNYREKKL